MAKGTKYHTLTKIEAQNSSQNLPNFVKISVPPSLGQITQASTSPGRKQYRGLSSDQKARAAVVNAFAASHQKLVTHYDVLKIVGFGSNGVVLGARPRSSDITTGVAIKVIYKQYMGKWDSKDELPNEIEILSQISEDPNVSPYILRYIEHWQDAYHHYLVTELFGSDWLSALPECPSIPPLVFSTTNMDGTHVHRLPFSPGSSDLHTWSLAHRTHLLATGGNSFLPLPPIRMILGQIAEALAYLHSKNIAHGDVKLENVLVAANYQTRLADLGHGSCDGKLSHYGTVEMAPPEFLVGGANEVHDGRCADVFALGMIFYLLLSERGFLPKAVTSYGKNAGGYQDFINSDDGDYPFDSIPDLDRIDPAWDLLMGMCKVNPRERLTILEVLEHPWFRG